MNRLDSSSTSPSAITAINSLIAQDTARAREYSEPGGTNWRGGHLFAVLSAVKHSRVEQRSTQSMVFHVGRTLSAPRE